MQGDRVMAYLDHSTRRELIATVERELLASHSQAILDKGARAPEHTDVSVAQAWTDRVCVAVGVAGFAVLMDLDKQEDLKLLYRLMQRINAVPALNEHFKAYVKVGPPPPGSPFPCPLPPSPVPRPVGLLARTWLCSAPGAISPPRPTLCGGSQVHGAELVADPEKDKTMVASLLEFKKRIDALHKTAFMSNDDFKRSVKVRSCLATALAPGARLLTPARVSCVTLWPDRRARSSSSSTQGTTNPLK